MFCLAAKCIPINTHQQPAMLLPLLGVEWDEGQLHREAPSLKVATPSHKLVLLVIALIICHVGAVVSSPT